MRKRNKSDFKVKYDYQQICEELKILDMEHVVNQLDSSAQFMLIEKYLTYADIPCFAKFCYTKKDKNKRGAFKRKEIEKRVKKNILFYNDVKDMVNFETKNSKEKRFFVETKQSNITMPNDFYKFIEVPEPRKQTIDFGDEFSIYVVKKSVETYFISTKTNACLSKLGKEESAKDYDLNEDFMKIPLSTGVHGIGCKKNKIFHDIRSNVFAKDKMLTLVEKKYVSDEARYNIYFMFFRNPKFFNIVEENPLYYLGLLFNEEEKTSEESRTGQAKWRNLLAELEIATKEDNTVRCPISGTIVNYSNEGTLLRASHIKRYSDCKDDSGQIDIEKAYDTENGLLITANADALFDKYLISIDPDNGSIVFSKIISKELKTQLKFLKAIEKSYLSPKRKVYLKEHYEKFQNKESERTVI